MARATINLPTDFIDSLNAASAVVDSSAEDVLQAGAAVVEPRMRSNLQASISDSDRSTGQLLAALGTTSARVNAEGNHNVKVGFAENRRDGRSHALIATVLEYGRSNQPARPFLAPTRSQTRGAATEAMKQALAARIDQVAP